MIPSGRRRQGRSRCGASAAATRCSTCRAIGGRPGSSGERAPSGNSPAPCAHVDTYPPVCIVGSHIFENFEFPKKTSSFVLDFFGSPRGREWAQNVPPGTSFRTPKYRPNPASGDPIGGNSAFLNNHCFCNLPVLLLKTCVKSCLSFLRLYT